MSHDYANRSWGFAIAQFSLHKFAYERCIKSLETSKDLSDIMWCDDASHWIEQCRWHIRHMTSIQARFPQHIKVSEIPVF